MDNIYDRVLQYKSEAATLAEELEKILKNGPEECLAIIRRGHRHYFNIRTCKNGMRTSKYLAKDNVRAVRPYALKYFASKTLPGLRRNIRAAEAFLKLYSRDEPAAFLERTAPEILPYCREVYVSKASLVSDWLSSRGPESPQYLQEPGVTTADGTAVRSKSEAIIYNILKANGIAFLYEKALYLEQFSFPFFPDFTILNTSTMEELYWEHFGLVDDPDYLERMIEKVSAYIQNGIIPGKSLICTFESRAHPFSSFDAEKIVQAIKALSG